MATPPGTPGYTLVGDKSVEFYRDAISFVDRRITQHNSRVFLTRLLNKPTVCVASNNGVRQVLCGECTPSLAWVFMYYNPLAPIAHVQVVLGVLIAIGSTYNLMVRTLGCSVASLFGFYIKCHIRMGF